MSKKYISYLGPDGHTPKRRSLSPNFHYQMLLHLDLIINKTHSRMLTIWEEMESK